jgi:CheY-like chemotaxis protein
MNSTAGLQRLEGSVLVADDVDIMRVTCQRALEREGFEVAAVASGREALKQFNLRQFEVAVLDIRMPGISGLELLKMIRGSGNPGEVIMMTAYADAGVAEEALNFGASAVLIKPFEDIRALVEAVKNSVARVQLWRGNSTAGLGLLQALLQVGMLNEDQANQVRAEVAATGKSFRAAAADLGLADKDEMDWAIATFLGISYVRLTEEMLDHDLIKNFPPRLAREYRCFPLFHGGEELHLVTANPFSAAARLAIGEALETSPVFALGDEAEIDALIAKYYGGPPPLRLDEWAQRIKTLGPLELAAVMPDLLASAAFEAVGRAALEPVDAGCYRLDLQATLKPKA